MEKIFKNLKPFLFYITMFIFLLAMSCFFNGVDPDYWAKLLQGKAFFELGHILKEDPYSYMQSPFWYDHEWGSSIVFYYIQSHFNWLGIIILKTTLLFLILFFIIQSIKLQNIKYTKTPYNILIFFFIFHSMYTLIISGIRCHYFTFMFFTMFIYMLELVRHKNKNKLLFLFPPIMLIWNNLHGGCVAGLGLILLYAVGEFLNKKPFIKYLYTFLASAVMLFINPYGVEYVKYLISATTMERPMILEWQNPFLDRKVNQLLKFKVNYIIGFLLLLVSFIRTKIVCKQRIDFTKYLVLLVTAYLSFNHIKHSPFFVITTAIFLYDEFYFVFNGIIHKIRDLLHLNNKTFVNVIILLKETLMYIFVLVASSILIFASDYKPRIVGTFYPYKIVEFLKINNLTGTVLNEFGIGSYLCYKLYPYNLIYMDGRYEAAYADNTFQVLQHFYLATESWEAALKTQPAYIIINEKSKIYKKVINDKEKRYTPIYKDRVYVLFTKTKYKKNNYKQPVKDLKYYNEHMFDIRFKFTDKIYRDGKLIEFK